MPDASRRYAGADLTTTDEWLEGKFSLQYALAVGVLYGQSTLWSFTDEAVKRPQVHYLLTRICIGEDPRCAGDDPLFETRSSGSRGFEEVEAVRQGRSCRSAGAPPRL
jgi:2-methylcitrate dehydratase PrpD